MTQTQQKNNVLEFPGNSQGAEVVKADTDEGYTRIANTLLEAVYRCDLTARQSRVLLAVIRKTYGFNRKMDWLSAPLIAEAINYSGNETNIRADLRALKARKIIISDGRKVGPNPILSEWEMAKRIENNPDRKQSANGSKTIRQRIENNPVNGSKSIPTKDSIKNNKKDSNKKTKGAVFNPPEWLNKELFGEYVSMRQKMRKPMTDYAKTLAVKKLSGLMDQGYDQDALINLATESNWLSFYPPKTAPNKPTAANTNQANAMSWLEKKKRERGEI